MFCAVALSDVEVLKKLAKECGGEYDERCTLNMVLIVGEELCGVSNMRYVDPKTIRLEWVGLREDMRGKGFGDFLTRSSINKAIDISEYIEISVFDEYYLKFGFEKCGDKMICESKKVVFPSKCKH